MINDYDKIKIGKWRPPEFYSEEKKNFYFSLLRHKITLFFLSFLLAWMPFSGVFGQDIFTCPCTGISGLNLNAGNGMTAERLGLPENAFKIYIMKKLILLILGLFPLLLLAQKEDYNWRLGYNTSSIYSQGNIRLTFDDDGNTDTIRLNNSILEPGAKTNISSPEGELLFTYSGKYLENSNFETIDTLYDFAWINTTSQNAIFLPYPNHPNQYVLFHTDKRTYSDVGTKTSDVYYTIVDRTLNNGQGGVDMSKVPLIEADTLLGRISAVHHANGRDWWVLIGKFNSKTLYTFLLTPAGPTLHHIQEAEFSIKTDLAQTVFSPDGQIYAILNHINYDGDYLDVFSFDRCTGMVSNQIKIYIPNPHDWGAGVAISPNSRFLYASSQFKLYQFDLQATDIEASKVVLTEYDYDDTWYGVSTLAAAYYLMQVAPNGKIYFCTSNGQKLLHVIEEPNKQGDACNYREHGLELPTWNSQIPNFPNYRLGPVDESLCDSLGLDNNPIAKWSYRLDSLDYHKVYFREYSDYLPNTYHWDFGDGQISTEQEPTHTYATTGDYNVCLIVTNVNSSDTLCRIVTVNATKILFPKAKILMDTFGCWPETVHFKAEVENADYFQWEYVNGPTIYYFMRSTDSVLTFDCFTPRNYVVHLTAYNELGSTKVAKKFIVYDPPKANLVVGKYGNGYNLQGASSEGVLLDYYFDTGDGVAGYYDEHLQHTYDSFGTYEVTLIVSNGCGSDTATQTIVIDSSSFEGLTYPFVLFQADTLSGCAPLTVEYKAQTFNTDSLTWSFPGGNPSMSQEDNVVVTYDSAGVYDVIANVVGVFSYLTNFAFKKVTVYEGPVADYTFDVSNQTIITHNESTNATTYYWDFGDGGTDSLANPIHTFAQAGSYDIVLYVTNECGTDSLSRNLFITAIEQPDMGISYSIFPNPSAGLFTFETTSSLTGKLDLTIYNFLGQTILRKQLALGEQLMEVDLGRVASGIYWYRVDYQGAVGYGKLIRN